MLGAEAVSSISLRALSFLHLLWEFVVEKLLVHSLPWYRPAEPFEDVICAAETQPSF